MWSGYVINAAVLGGILWIVFLGVKRLLAERAGPVMVCSHCGHHGATVQRVKGSTGIELVLWLMFIVPGVVYGLWRMSTRRPVCTSCGSDQLVPPLSPVGRRLLDATPPAGLPPEARSARR